MTAIGPIYPHSERIPGTARAAPATGRSRSCRDCGAHASDDDSDVSLDEPRWHAQGLDPVHCEDPIAGHVILAPPRVDCSVDLDGNGSRGSKEVYDEPTEDHLPSKADPKLGAAELLPQEPFRPGGRFPHVTSAWSEERRREFEGAKTVAHEGLRAGVWAGFEPLPRRARDSGKFGLDRHARPLARDVRDSSTPAHSPTRRHTPSRLRTIAACRASVSKGIPSPGPNEEPRLHTNETRQYAPSPPPPETAALSGRFGGGRHGVESKIEDIKMTLRNRKSPRSQWLSSPWRVGAPLLVLGLLASCSTKDRKSTRLNSSHSTLSRMPSSA